MGIREKLHLFKNKDNVVENSSKEAARKCVLKVQDKFRLRNTDDIVVVGELKGKIQVGDAVYMSNFSDDDGEILVTVVLGIEVGQGKTVREAENCRVGLKLEQTGTYPIKCGTMIYSRATTVEEVHDTYISGLGDTYVSSKQLVLSQKELDELSITDCSEIWRLYAWYKTKVIPAKDDAEKEEVRKRIGVIAKALVQKVLEAPAIYCVYSKITGEPALFSQTVDRQDGTYMCTPPDIWILTKAYKDIFKVRFPEERYEIREIKNDDSHKAIYNFLGYCFYMNGACGVKVVNENTAIAAPEFVPEPDYSNIPEISVPVTNPDLVRWMLLIAQLGQPVTDEQKLIYKLYFRFLSIEMTKARFIIPTKTSADFPEPDENGKTVLKKDMQISLPTIEGKHNNAAVRMYTDWKRLQDAMGDGWKGMVQSIEGIIDQFDCAINLTEHEKAGCYVDREMFREMQSFEKDFQQNN